MIGQPSAVELVSAKKEIEEARQNRNSQIGIFVFSRVTAPAELEPFARYGSDIMVVWDRDDPATDIFLRVAMSVARALVIRERVTVDQAKLGLDKVRKASMVLTKDIDFLEEITKWAGTIKNNSEKILAKVGRVRSDLEEQLAVLKEHVAEWEQEEDSISTPA